MRAERFAVMAPNAFDRYLGKIFAHVSDDLKADAKRHGYRLNVRDPDAPADIDREADRLDVRVDADFVIREISVG
jgi:hypothetical protein